MLLLAGDVALGLQPDPFNMAVDGDTCMAPVICDSPALALAQRPRIPLAPRLPHDSATSLVRLDMQLLPSPLSKGVVLLSQSISESQPEANLADGHGSHDSPGWKQSALQPLNASAIRDSQSGSFALSTRPVTMIISPDDHNSLQTQGNPCEEDFVLHSAPLIASPGSDSAADESAESPMMLSPESPADRPMLPNSAPGFLISPSPVPFHRMAQDSPAQIDSVPQQHMRIEDATAVEPAVSAAVEVDDVDALNMLLK